MDYSVLVQQPCFFDSIEDNKGLYLSCVSLQGRHGDHPVADVFHHGPVVGDEQHGQMALVAQPLQQMDDLRLDGNIERRDRLVSDDEVGIRNQRPWRWPPSASGRRTRRKDGGLQAPAQVRPDPSVPTLFPAAPSGPYDGS